MEQKEKRNVQWMNQLANFVDQEIDKGLARYRLSAVVDGAEATGTRLPLQLIYQIYFETSENPRKGYSAYQWIRIRLKVGVEDLYLPTCTWDLICALLEADEPYEVNPRFTYDPLLHRVEGSHRKALRALKGLAGTKQGPLATLDPIIQTVAEKRPDGLIFPLKDLPDLVEALEPVDCCEFSYQPLFWDGIHTRPVTAKGKMQVHPFSLRDLPVHYRVKKDPEATGEWWIERFVQADFPILKSRRPIPQQAPLQSLIAFIPGAQMVLKGTEIFCLDEASTVAMATLDNLHFVQVFRQNTEELALQSSLTPERLIKLAELADDLRIRYPMRGGSDAPMLLTFGDPLPEEWGGLPEANPELYLEEEEGFLTATFFPFGRQAHIDHPGWNRATTLAAGSLGQQCDFYFRNWTKAVSEWPGADRYTTRGTDSMGQFFYDELPRIQQESTFTILVSETLQSHFGAPPHLPRGTVSFQGQSRDYLEVSFQSAELTQEELKKIWRERLEGKRFTRLTDQRILDLQSEAFEVFDLWQNLGLDPTQLQEKVQIPFYKTLFWREKVNRKGFELSEAVKDFYQEIRQFQEETVAWPHTLTATPLPYQLEGLRWLCALDHFHLSGVLADDMGLGKTLQLIALLANRHLANEHPDKPTLILCPSSVLYNWEREWHRFCPTLPLVLVSGQKNVREEAIKKALSSKSPYILTSYPLFVRDEALYRQLSWDTLVLDESQTVKNRGTMAYKALSHLDRRIVFALSGTPVENHPEELYNLFSLLLPDFFGSVTAYRKLPQDVIAQRVRPFVLRRLKKDVLKELPPKTEETIFIDLTEEQKSLYLAQKHWMTEGYLLADSFGNRGWNRMQILAGLTRLRQICCDPRLVTPDSVTAGVGGGQKRPQKEAEVLDLMEEAPAFLEEVDKSKGTSDGMKGLPQDGSSSVPPAEAERLPQAEVLQKGLEAWENQSAKLTYLLQLLERAFESGHRVVVFSQFTAMLSLIRQSLEKKGWPYFYLDGQTPARDRFLYCQRFNRGEGNLFLLSMKAGGTGINLTGGDLVVLYDSWWNPAVEEQAADRVYRIGQKQPVTVMRLVATGTVEEHLLALQEEKKELFANLIQKGQVSLRSLSDEDIAQILGVQTTAEES